MKTHLDLFSGIGGFALACRWNNIQTVGFVEYEDYPRRVLSRQFPGVPLFGDIRDFDATPFRGVDLLTGGYPCQPFSLSGKRKGKEDDRHLWPEMFRVITQARPSWVLAENVAGHINLGLDEVLLDLESEGYTCRTLVVPACAKNALHRRDRCWIIAKRNAGDTEGNRGSQVGQVSGRSDSNSRGVCTAASGESRSDVGNPKCFRQSQPEHEGRPRSEEGIPERSGSNVAHTEGNGLQGGRIGNQGSDHSEEVGQGRAESIGAGAGSSSRDVAHSQCQPIRDQGSGQDAGKTSSLQGELRERQRIRVDSGECSKDVAHSDSKRGRSRDSKRQDAEDAGQSSRGAEHGGRNPQPNLGGAVDGLSDGLDFPRRWGDGSWEEGIPRVTMERKNRTHRLKALGNAIVPQIAYELIRCMKEIDESE